MHSGGIQCTSMQGGAVRLSAFMKNLMHEQEGRGGEAKCIQEASNARANREGRRGFITILRGLIFFFGYNAVD